MIYIASDHGGFKLKEQVKKVLKKMRLDFADLGPEKLEPNDDYPVFAVKVASKVSKKPLLDLGILLCRSGQGVNIVANKFKNVRSAVIWNDEEARASRHDDMTNVLCLPSDYISPVQAEIITRVWLQTPWGKEDKHGRRIKEISGVEKKNFK